MIRRTILLVTVSAVMAVTLAGGAAVADPACGYEGSVWTCKGGSGGGGSIDTNGDGTPDGGCGGGLGGSLEYDTTNDNALTESRGYGHGCSDPDYYEQPNGGYGQHCTGTLNEPECVGGTSPGLGG
jgi:hypothetical protein